MQYTENNSTYYTVRNEIKVDALCSLSSFYFYLLFLFLFSCLLKMLIESFLFVDFSVFLMFLLVCSHTLYLISVMAHFLFSFPHNHFCYLCSIFSSLLLNSFFILLSSIPYYHFHFVFIFGFFIFRVTEG